jgi:hypothetical protein
MSDTTDPEAVREVVTTAGYVPFHTTPIPDVGPLPPDLLSAFNGAAELVSRACAAAQLIVIGGPHAFDTARNFLLHLAHEHPPARDAILKVASDLAKTRQYRGPARVGNIVRGTAHEAALALSVDVNQRIRSAVLAARDAIEQAEPGSWALFVDPHEATPDLDWLHRHFRTWRGHFNGAGLPSPDDLMAELALEASQAALARTPHAGQGRPVEPNAISQVVALGQIPPVSRSAPTTPPANPPSAYDYVSTEDAIRAARQGALDVLRGLERLRWIVNERMPPEWYAEAARWLVDSWARRRTRWPAAVQTTALARHLPAAAVLAPAVQTVERLIPEIALACINALPYVEPLAHALARALCDAPPDNLDLFYLGDLPRLLCVDCRWAVTREDRITPTLRRLRTDSAFRQARKGIDGVICKWEVAHGEAEAVTPAQYRRATTGIYSGGVDIDIDELRRVLAAYNPDALRSPLADGAALDAAPLTAAAAVEPDAQSAAVPWEGDDWDDLEPLVKRLLTYMHGRERGVLEDLCRRVWGKDRGDRGVTESALSTALSKANAFLRVRESRRVLEKPRGEAFVRWA